jgi:hypothetical protein
MNVKIKIHYMPWEVDYALLQFMQLKKSSQHLSADDKISFHIGLNLSNYIIDWDNSKLPKEYFKNKFNALLKMLDWAEVNVTIYEGDELWGHLDLEKKQIDSKTNYYMSLCPDMWFHEHALFYIIESAKQIKNKYFLITPQISKVGDADWDEITNPKYMDIPYSDYLKTDIFDIDYDRKNSNEEISLYPTQKPKFAGWFDLYSKSFYEELCPFLDEWTGYGPWDLYSLIILNNIKQYNVDFQQYLLKGETIWMYPSGPLFNENIDGFSKYYKDFLYLNKHKDNQRQIFESKLSEYINKTLTQLKEKNII